MRRMADLLIHSLSELREIVLGVLDAAEPRHVVEVGAESGGFTERLLEWLAPRGGRLTTIDPAPAEKVRALGAMFPRVHRLITERSPAALDGLDPAQVYVLDGDHNYWVVWHELEAIHAACGAEPKIVILHDVGWPCGRRDQYYSPSALPAGAVHPHTYERGVHLDSVDPIEGGFRGEGAFAAAVHEGGPKNGVLTAVEDFMAAHPGHELAIVPAVFGLGVLFDAAHPRRDALRALLDAYDQNPLLARLEENRLRNYLQVIALQDRLGVVEAERAAERGAHQLEREAQRAENERLVGEVRARAAQVATLERRGAELAARVAELEAHVAELEAQWYHRYGARLSRAVGLAVDRAARTLGRKGG